MAARTIFGGTKQQYTLPGAKASANGQVLTYSAEGTAGWSAFSIPTAAGEAGQFIRHGAGTLANWSGWTLPAAGVTLGHFLRGTSSTDSAWSGWALPPDAAAGNIGRVLSVTAAGASEWVDQRPAITDLPALPVAAGSAGGGATALVNTPTLNYRHWTVERVRFGAAEDAYQVIELASPTNVAGSIISMTSTAALTTFEFTVSIPTSADIRLPVHDFWYSTFIGHRPTVGPAVNPFVFTPAEAVVLADAPGNPVRVRYRINLTPADANGVEFVIAPTLYQYRAVAA